MKWNITPDAVNQFAKGTEIFIEGEAVFSVALVLKGRVLIHNSGAKYMVGSGIFIGINDLYEGTYQSTYTAQDDIILYVFSVSQSEDLETIFSINKDYRGLMVASLNRMIYELDKIYREFMKNGLEIYQFITDQYKEYMDMASDLGYEAAVSDRIETLKMYQSDIELERDKINYYKECYGMPIDIVKSFYSYGDIITMYQIEDQVNLVNEQIGELERLSERLKSMAECLVDEDDTSLFRLIVNFALESGSSEADSTRYMDIMDSIIEKINMTETFYDQMVGVKLEVNRKLMEEAYHLLLTGTKENETEIHTGSKYTSADADKAILELSNSYHRLLEYAEIENDKAKDMEKIMSDFVGLGDRHSMEDSVRLIRKKLSENYYSLYKAVFLKAYKENEIPRYIDLFLKYGYEDERLLTKEQLVSLYYLKEEEPAEDDLHIYNIKEWLTLIYEGKREPSKNEFDLEYHEMLLSLKKQGKLTEKEIREWTENREKKLDYEIQNMFRYNNRTTNGQISSFVPVLHKDMVMGHFGKIYLSREKICDAVKDLMHIDYSIFDREVLYVNKEKNIQKEYIIKRVYPDIILMPTVGCNGIMWQEITGKRRDSSGRFMLPIFCETDLSALMVRMFGRFRWEMCRTIEGTAWNDIKHKSLTSEYSDYLQFYRKNRELSDEKKEKIKLQIQKGRNSSREIFASDYEQWVIYESTGAIKLNKLIRELMATYCPFSKEIRERLSTQPLFEEAMARYKREKLKKIRETEGRHRLLQKENIEVTPELIDTLNYLKEF